MGKCFLNLHTELSDKEPHCFEIIETTGPLATGKVIASHLAQFLTMVRADMVNVS